MKSGLVSVNTTRQVNAAHTKTTVNAARPTSYLSKTAHSTVKKPIHKNTTFKNSNFNQSVNTVKDKNVNTVRPKAVVNTAKSKAVVNAARPKAVVNAIKGNNVNAVKASASTKDETSGILKSFITGVENLIDQRVKLISVARPPQQNRVAERRNRTLIEAARTMLADSKLTYLLFRLGQIGFLNIDALTKSMNYKPVIAGNQFMVMQVQKHVMMQSSPDAGFKPSGDNEKKVTEEPGKEGGDSNDMDVKSVFLYGKIKEEVYVCQPPGFEDPDFLDRVYKVEKALYGLHQALRACMETQKPLLKDEDGEEVDVHLYRSLIGSLMYLTSSRPDIMFAVCACARYQVNPKVSHLHVVKRIFRYLKGQPKLGLWYPKDSPFDLVAYTDSDYAGASLDRKSTTGGCQFLGCRLISWQCKKQTVVANSTTEAEYVAASSCCGQVLWIQNQLLDYGYNFMHTKIYIDNESTICIVKNPVFHSKTKHIEIRHHFIRDSNEKKLIQMIKIHTDKNVADLLTKAFDNGIGVNAGDSKLMLLGINLLLLGKVNAARHKLTAARERKVNAARHKNFTVARKVNAAS
ncbi:putative reverse transcriptase, RNA-dependent DNA polymerase [Tanacetum coccineum]